MILVVFDMLFHSVCMLHVSNGKKKFLPRTQIVKVSIHLSIKRIFGHFDACERGTWSEKDLKLNNHACRQLARDMNRKVYKKRMKTKSIEFDSMHTKCLPNEHTVRELLLFTLSLALSLALAIPIAQKQNEGEYGVSTVQLHAHFISFDMENFKLTKWKHTHSEYCFMIDN